MKLFAQYKSDGKLWRAGHTVLGLCAAFNHATNPSAMMTSEQHARSIKYARAIKNRILREGHKFTWGKNGELWPVKH